jgi:hypothetical protein
VEYLSFKDVMECERLSKLQRFNNTHFLRFDESKASSARAVMALHRFRGAIAAGQIDAFDKMLSEPEVNELFRDGAIYLERP